ncbi:MAG: SPOR domain-containing protein, partial [Loktanella sp.]|nr:SPOR domain-containing protein [Loktanella sp.]
MAVYDQGQAPLSGAARAGVLVNYAGAAISCALIIGVGVWGYKLVMRDVTGIPVVRAMTGDMRSLPENPGGEVTLHTGLSVNEVAAVGEAAPPEDTVALAPVTRGLSEEDLEAQPMAEADEVFASVDPLGTVVATAEVTPTTLNADQLVDAPLSTDDILALADQIADGAQPLTDLADGEDVAPTLSVAGEAVLESSGSASAVSVSLRPMARASTQAVAADASGVNDALAAALSPAPAEEVANLVTETNFAAGTNLVQLGAFPASDVAATEWTRRTG